MFSRFDKQRWRRRDSRGAGRNVVPGFRLPAQTVRRGRRGYPIVRLPSAGPRVALVAGIVVCAFGIILFRLWSLQILNGNQYVAQANSNRLRSVTLAAPRGAILDHNGKVLVDNRPGLVVGIRPMDVPAGQLSAVIARLAPVLGMTPAEVRHQLAVDTGYVYDLKPVKGDVSKTAVSYILEHQLSFPGVEVQQVYLRDYPQGEMAAQVLGYVGQISQPELTSGQFNGAQPGDLVGQAGVEGTYDQYLRGQDGKAEIEVNALGVPVSPGQLAGGQLPQAGDNLVLSIDSGVQQAAQNALAYGMKLAHQTGNAGAGSGAAIVLDAKTGAVIAMASDPTYNPSIWAGGISAKNYAKLMTAAANEPLLNRAIAGVYPTGSTFKVVDTIAALQEGVITPTTTLYCPAALTFDGTVFHDWNPNGHGMIDVSQAIAQSADTFFYQIGYKFYLRKGTELENWATRLGYGKPTGIDIPGEVAGVVPTPAWRQKTYTNAVDKLWTPGDSINLAIGQGDLLATPLQVAVSYAAVANGGYIVTPHLGVKVENANGSLVTRLPYTAPRKIGVSQQTIDVVRGALRLVTSSPQGTGYGVFGNYPIAVSGKTGTAQVLGKGNVSWFASFAPSNDPRYVVVVMIDQGGEGASAAAPAARMIYDSLFNKHTGKATGVTTGD
ncbi:MAG: penicillin-binding protein 2 [Thermoleophilia bacterium]